MLASACYCAQSTMKTGKHAHSRPCRDWTSWSRPSSPELGPYGTRHSALFQNSEAVSCDPGELDDLGAPGLTVAKRSPNSLSIHSATTSAPFSVCHLSLVTAAVGHSCDKVAASCFTGTWVFVKWACCVHKKCGKNNGGVSTPHPHSVTIIRNLFVTNI